MAYTDENLNKDKQDTEAERDPAADAQSNADIYQSIQQAAQADRDAAHDATLKEQELQHNTVMNKIMQDKAAGQAKEAHLKANKHLPPPMPQVPIYDTQPTLEQAGKSLVQNQDGTSYAVPSVASTDVDTSGQQGAISQSLENNGKVIPPTPQPNISEENVTDKQPPQTAPQTSAEPAKQSVRDWLTDEITKRRQDTQDAVKQDQINKLIAMGAGALGKIGTGMYGLKTGVPVQYDPQNDKNLQEQLSGGEAVKAAMEREKDLGAQARDMAMAGHYENPVAKTGDAAAPGPQAYMEEYLNSGDSDAAFQAFTVANGGKPPTQNEMKSLISLTTGTSKEALAEKTAGIKEDQGNKGLDLKDKSQKHKEAQDAEKNKIEWAKIALAKEKALRDKDLAKLPPQVHQQISAQRTAIEGAQKILNEIDTYQKDMGKGAGLAKKMKLTVKQYNPFSQDKLDDYESGYMAFDNELSNNSIELFRTMVPRITNAEIKLAKDSLAGGVNTDPNQARKVILNMIEKGRTSMQNTIDAYKSDSSYKTGGIERMIPPSSGNVPVKSSTPVSQYPMQVRKNGKIATVKNDQEYQDASSKGWK